MAFLRHPAWLIGSPARKRRPFQNEPRELRDDQRLDFVRQYSLASGGGPYCDCGLQEKGTYGRKAANCMSQTVYGVLIPFLGTSLGAACVFFMRRQFSDAVQRVLIGFAAGVMVAASVWSLLIPAIEQVAWMGKLAFLPAFVGFWIGILFLLGLDHP